jgi:hypothetical protein
VACLGEDRIIYKILLGKPEGKRPLERWTCRWKGGIRLDLRETGWEVRSEFNWLRIETGSGRLWIRR